jgi:hypothetical protein
MKNCLRVTARLKNLMVHFVEGDLLYVSSRDKIMVVENFDKPVPKTIKKIPYPIIQKLMHSRTVDRLMRNDIRYIHKIGDGSYIACSRKGWWHIDSKGKLSNIPELKRIQPLARGLCTSKLGIIYVGDYSQNHDRDEVKIYRSDNGKRFVTAYNFGKKSVRHIHAIIADTFNNNRLWVLTGDNNDESHFYFTDDDFKSIHKFLSVGQISRAADLLIENDEILWGTDSPFQQNFIVKTSLQNPYAYEKISPLPGPVYYTSQNAAGGIYFGTTAEPGPASENKIARIFALYDKKTCNEIHNCRRDFIPQHGIIYFPAGILPENYIVFSQRGLRPYESYLTIARDENL